MFLILLLTGGAAFWWYEHNKMAAAAGGAPSGYGQPGAMPVSNLPIEGLPPGTSPSLAALCPPGMRPDAGIAGLPEPAQSIVRSAVAKSADPSIIAQVRRIYESAYEGGRYESDHTGAPPPRAWTQTDVLRYIANELDGCGQSRAANEIRGLAGLPARAPASSGASSGIPAGSPPGFSPSSAGTDPFAEPSAGAATGQYFMRPGVVMPAAGSQRTERYEEGYAEGCQWARMGLRKETTWIRPFEGEIPLRRFSDRSGRVKAFVYASRVDVRLASGAIVRFDGAAKQGFLDGLKKCTPVVMGPRFGMRMR